MLKATLLKATEASGKILQQYFDGPFEVTSKSSINDLVTEVDKKSEEAIIAVIKETYPDHFILSEEVGELKSASSVKWIIDPIDGTVNFANGIPLCCISIGVEKDGEIILGAVYNPFMNELFVAEKGQGATLNNRPIKVSSKTNIEQTCLVTGFPYQWQDMPNNPLQAFETIVKKGIPVRRLGSAAIDLCWVACGRFDGFYEHHLQPWDSAAGSLIVTESGGRITDFSGNPYSPYQKQVLATNGHIHQALQDLVNGK
ncbi:myo-inositol-1(or 4)-monophosphatase [Chitinophaga terrae (ex Kim and Jung 2007)]|jgi:myo-inositol-1(or 4)-monophosphatase|uniref:Inositol-1-monophosphatase n=1 Tax=Chitinophaga terrae (ex Kim and Jung 2007) TaxID=408074 RepID=A0A1H3XTP6_9BACT|nr:inositol monophosphatase family protein [Chitinophaga terrae (ex Kim and Jung 2007)]MDQ0105716.1 myo-inositol-1(or 4)-monophosphatase [Chitinophaga terrae (ex Kim and Jung 2007)]GEP89389.1 inositol monophosphatase [Chitinophaga terrae (ex Kim and Jung 2007)]SEA02867.1 myo-inositol-1(or 4)-monophosphatase [Chitinophaga terrae (ex Kim and Jung 2007)]